MTDRDAAKTISALLEAVKAIDLLVKEKMAVVTITINSSTIGIYLTTGTTEATETKG